MYLVIGYLVAIGLFVNPRLERDHLSGAIHQNLYSLCCEEISQRFATFYHSFNMVMKAQITISAIDTVLTGIFMAGMGLPHLVVAVGVTFLCGLIPVVGNLISDTLVVALGSFSLFGEEHEHIVSAVIAFWDAGSVGCTNLRWGAPHYDAW